MTILDTILAAKRDEVALRKSAVSLRDLDVRIADQTPPRGFRTALDAAKGYALIAEIKRASPSKGLIRDDFDPPAHARAYRDGGAACLSVLTDETFFRGSDDALIQARAAVSLPVLRKDFVIDPWQVDEARSIGADAVLLIVAALDDETLYACEAAAIGHGMDVLVEVHDAPELERALRLRSRLIGCNNRDLRDFSVDVTRSYHLRRLAPTDCTFVAESGLSTRADLDAMADHGINTFLVGEALMRQDDVEAATRALIG
jgi:indole-3-glycerol phosphate synthase